MVLEEDFTADDVPRGVRRFAEYVLDEKASSSPDQEMEVLPQTKYGVLERLVSGYDEILVEDGINDWSWSHDALGEDYLGLRNEALIGDVYISTCRDSCHPVFNFERYDGTGSDIHLLYAAVDPDMEASLKDQGIPADMSGVHQEVEIPEINIHGVSVDASEKKVYMRSLPFDDLSFL